MIHCAPKLSPVDPDIDLSRLHRRVSEQGLHSPDVVRPLVDRGGEPTAQTVCRPALRQRARDQRSDVIGGQVATVGRRERPASGECLQLQRDVGRPGTSCAVMSLA